jgi:hypothetical protein
MDAKTLVDRFQTVKRRYHERDERMARIFAARHNRLMDIAPDLFPEDGPLVHPVIANTLDVAARDMAEQISPLPSFTCASPNMVTEKDQARANLRTKIAGAYVDGSRLGQQMQSAADWLVTYGFLPGRVEINKQTMMPEIRLIDPRGCYPVFDRMNRLVSIYQMLKMPTDQLCELYPEFEDQILTKDQRLGRQSRDGDIEIVFYHDKDADVAFLPGRGVVLSNVKNKFGKVLYRVAQRPGLTNIPQGQFDDALWVQVIRNSYAILKYEAMEKSVHAPTALPNDVQNLALGPNSVVRSANPQLIRKVGLDIPQGAFAMDQMLEEEVRKGARYPESRTGNASQSIVTGRGVQELAAGFDSQIASYQAAIAYMLTDLVSLAFEVDEHCWATETKTIRGQASGSPFEAKYTPAKDIKGDYTVTVTYGMMAGLDPNRALIFSLQAQGAGLLSKDTVRRNLPGGLDVGEEERKIDTERLEAAALMAVEQYAAAIPAMAAQGQDVSKAVRAIALVQKGRAAGKPIADLIAEAFGVNLDPAPAAAPVADPMAAMAAAGGPAAAGAPAEAGPPDLMTLMANIGQGGNPQMGAQVQRSVAI